MKDLSHANITVWSASLVSTAEELARYLPLLSLDEQQRASRFRLPLHRHRFIAARGQLRLLLGETLGQPPGTIPIAYTEHGKPYVSEQRVQFNLAHVNDEMLCAVTWDHAVGIDFEDVRREIEIMTVARAFFTADEISQLDALPPDAQRRVFFNLWTRKEAFLKARGVGLRFDGLSTPIPLKFTSFVAKDQTRWSIVSFSHGSHICAALVTSADVLSMQIRDFSP